MTPCLKDPLPLILWGKSILEISDPRVSDQSSSENGMHQNSELRPPNKAMQVRKALSLKLSVQILDLLSSRGAHL